MHLKEFRDKLCGITKNVYHFMVPEEKESYIVWNETGIEHQFCDNICLNKNHLVKVSYRTKKEYDEIPSKIEQMFDDSGIYYSNCKIQFDIDTGIIYYTWEVRFIG